ncbi:BBE domain-containing protein [Kribbella sp. NPDC051718]|uniref:BBE domain-containing protein n=1 Tax=Kribbella sp. NPDC051718 TaxID=3155168 RepID=UPI003449BDEC
MSETKGQDFSRRRMLAGSATAALGGVVTAAGLGGTATASASTGAAEAVPPIEAVTVRPGDPRYSQLITGNNSRWVAAPEAVRLVGTTEQVVQAVQEAVRTGKRLSVRGGGHCFEDFVYNPDIQVVIDLSRMKAVYYDAQVQAFAVEGGALLMDVYDSLFKGWGVTIPGGMCYSVGIGGHVSGGGYGLLSRTSGLTVDHLYAVEVVVVDRSGTAKAVVATREPNDPNRDLWWAHTGGGGGNFGVITRYWFRSPGATGSDPSTQLVKPPTEALVNVVAFPWASIDKPTFTRLVSNYGAWHEANGAPGSPNAGLSSFFTLYHRSNGNLVMLTALDANAPNPESRLRDYVAAITAGTSVVPIQLTAPRRLPWLASIRLLGTSNPVLTNPTLRGAHKSTYMKKNFPAAHIAALYKHLTRTDYANPNAMVTMLSFGGKINSVAENATASAQRSSTFKLLYQAFWSDKSEDAQHIGWVRDLYREVYADTGGVPVSNSLTDGCYVNYPDGDLRNAQQNTSGVPWSTLYYKGNYSRLQQVKARWDPRNVFRHSQSIELPS